MMDWKREDLIFNMGDLLSRSDRKYRNAGCGSSSLSMKTKDAACRRSWV